MQNTSGFFAVCKNGALIPRMKCKPLAGHAYKHIYTHKQYKKCTKKKAQEEHAKSKLSEEEQN